MADLSFSAEIDTRSASRSLDALKSQILNFGSAVAGAFAFKEVSTVSSRFEDLRTTLQLLYKDVQLGSAVFDDIKKFAASSVFSVEDLTQTIIKLRAAGVEPTISMLRMFADVSSVAADKVGALQAITDLYARTTAGGLGLEDLNRLADRGIPVFTILSDRLGLSRLQISEVGKSAEGARIILKALEDGLQDAFGGASESRANNVSQAMSNLGDAVSDASDAMGQAGLNEGLRNLIKSFTQLIESARPVIEIIGKVLGGIFNFLAENIKQATFAAAGFFAVMAVQRIVAIVKAFNLLNLVVGKGPWGMLARGLAVVGVAIGAMDDASKGLDEIFDRTNKSAEELVESDGFKALKEGNLGAGAENLKEKVKALNEQLNKFRVEMTSVVSQFARYNEENIRSLNLETALIGASRETQELRRAEAEINNRLAQEIAKLTEQKAKLTEQERKEGRGEIIDATIKKLKEQAEADKKATSEAITNSEARQKARQVELFSIQNRITLEDELMKIQDEMAKSTMSEIEAKYYDIERAAQRAAMAAIRAEEARLGRPLNVDEQKRYYDEARKGLDGIKEATTAQYEQSRLFSTGWGQAFKEYADNATNAATQARNIFQKMTQGMEDLIVNFAKTGKFEWKNFVNMMVEELLRSQVRQLMANIFNATGFGGGGAGGGSGNWLSNLMGFANGGIIPTNAPVVVGERGPEIISGAAGRIVTPNNQIGGAGNVTYNIQAVDAMSFKQLLAQDPSFLYALTQQGAKGFPTRR